MFGLFSFSVCCTGIGILDEDDSLISSAVNLGVFDFLQRTYLENAIIFKEVCNGTPVYIAVLGL